MRVSLYVWAFHLVVKTNLIKIVSSQFGSFGVIGPTHSRISEKLVPLVFSVAANNLSPLFRFQKTLESPSGQSKYEMAKGVFEFEMNPK